VTVAAPSVRPILLNSRQNRVGRTDITITHYDNRYTGGWEINVSAGTANKGRGVESLRRWIDGVTKVVAFGDNYNDVSMLEAADLAVAVANAPAEIQSLCRHVTQSNADRGVVQFIENYLAGL
jgi:hydroxymethylpyrimidine pyrophosphatase-like HAD family hydrolase